MKYATPFQTRIYGAGVVYGGVDGPTDTVDPVSGSVEGVRCLGEVYPASVYARTAFNLDTQDDAFRESLASLFPRIENHFERCPASVALSLEDCVLRDGIVHLVRPDGLSLLYTTYRDNDRAYVSPLAEDYSFKDLPVFETPGRLLIYLTSAGSLNYGHWLIDDLARLKYALDQSAPITVLLQTHGVLDKIYLRSLEALTRGRDVQFKFLAPYEALRCRNVIHVTPVSYHPYVKNAHALNWLRERLTTALPAEVGSAKRLYIKRRAHKPGFWERMRKVRAHILNKPIPPARGRQIVNSEAVEAAATDMGFIVCDPESLSFEAQMRLFAGATHIVGTMGAAMCNSVASSAGTKLLYLVPDGWVEPFYWDMASVLGHDYRVLAGPRAGAHPEPHNDNFTIDIERFRRSVSAFVKA